MTACNRSRSKSHRKAALVTATAAVLVVAFGGAMVLVGVGRTTHHRAQLQEQADGVALRLAAQLADGTIVANLADASTIVTPGQWDATHRRFLPGLTGANAVEVLVRDTVGQTRAVAAVRPRDIVLVVDLSSSMTARTRTLLDQAAAGRLEELSTPERHELAALYADLGFLAFPGPSEPFASPWNVGQGRQAYAALIDAKGPLAADSKNETLQIQPEDPISERRRKAYRAVIDEQVARLMPGVAPAADAEENFDYWGRYLDDLLASDDPEARIGYVSYLCFMLDYGRDIRVGGRHVALSRHGDDATWCSKPVGSAGLRFPPRTQPMHDMRRELIAAIGRIAARNRDIMQPTQRDRVAVVSFDSMSTAGVWIEKSLTHDYETIMRTCASLQASGVRAPAASGRSALQTAETLLKRARRSASRGREAIPLVVLVSAKSNVDRRQTALDQMIGMRDRGLSVQVVNAECDWRLPLTEMAGDSAVALVK